MKISTKGRYALRLMLDLALHNTGEYITIKSIAARQEISDKYLEQIITQLSKAGYVKSTRGSQGGYRLAKPPEEYTVGMILRLIEGSLSPVACLEDEPNQCNRSGHCATLDVWQKLDNAIRNVVDNITLADLVDKQNSLTGNDYVI
ncbi:AsnC family transcriptional regulator [Anaerocolumna cellulosilytica]|uniref:AsnC family transcriptional regulator n=1 Tax=Anaerocolumna cellulosilytica TaxID=433286 RepID=A0A6S6QPM3_9FIRM|nr:Rrf2 family transcriptional regulator [Anaerocolumna cellulosilytica]MBB5194379.1 Rrf2 family protein [Anaerocolumna cellulosilytica]BCJ93323.1 AsnC family transcriptional regulator [Anaerocolumna cellulosilytica]